MSVQRKIIDTPNAPKFKYPLCQAVTINNTLYISGFLGTEPVSGQLVPGGVEAQCRQVLANIKAVLQAAGADFDNVAKVTIMLADMTTFAAVNKIYEEMFKQPYPARTSFQAAALPLNCLIEIEAIAMLGEHRKVVEAENAPQYKLPFSQAVIHGNMMYLSGQAGVDPMNGQLVPGGVEAECRQVLANIRAVLKAAGADFKNVVKAIVLLADMADFAVVNKVYGETFQPPYPARAAYQVAVLPLRARIEIEVVAVVGDVHDA